MKKAAYILFVLSAVVLCACGGCKGPAPEPTLEPQPQEQEVDLSLIKQSVPVTNDWVWSGKPQITIHIENGNPVAVKAGVNIKITTDAKKAVTSIEDSVTVAANGAQDFVFTTTDNLEPGFYRASCFVNDKAAKHFNFGIDPFQIVSPPDMQPDFDQFWQAAKDQLAAIDMNAHLIELPTNSSDTRKVYLVELNSVPDGLTGEPVVVRGYYCEPQDGQKHPVIMHFYGYDTQNTKAKVECPSGGASQYAEFYLSHRGQYINNRPESSRVADGLGDLVNPYGDWFTYNFGDRDSWYYRGAFMDVVQAIRFMATRESSDMTKLFAEGSSQGGALTYAAAALSDYPFTAIACNVAFLGDYADAMQGIGGLAMELTKGARGTMSDAEVLRFLSYFDTKNLATRISCAVLASSGLQDNVCPPRTNTVPFNNLKTPEADKQYIFGPEMGHDYPKGWSSKMWELFKGRM